MHVSVGIIVTISVAVKTQLMVLATNARTHLQASSIVEHLVLVQLAAQEPEDPATMDLNLHLVMNTIIAVNISTGMAIQVASARTPNTSHAAVTTPMRCQ